MTRIDASQVEGLPAASGGGYPIAIARHVLPAGTAAGQASDDAWYDRELNELWTSSDWGASLASNQLTLPPGAYLIDWSIRCPPVAGLRVGLFDSADNPLTNRVASNLGLTSIYWRTQIGRSDFLVLSQQTAIKIRAYHDYAVGGYSGSSKGTSNTSPAIFENTLPNVYSQILATKVG